MGLFARFRSAGATSPIEPPPVVTPATTVEVVAQGAVADQHGQCVHHEIFIDEVEGGHSWLARVYDKTGVRAEHQARADSAAQCRADAITWVTEARKQILGAA